MARNRFQSWLLRTKIKCDVLFDPEKLDKETEYKEPKDSVSARFSKLPNSQVEAYRAQFKQHRPPTFFPLHIYKLSDPNNEEEKTRYGVHWEYDRPERRIEMKRLALAGFDLSRLGDTYYTFTQLRELRKAQEQGFDIEPLLDNRYDRFQLMVLNKIMRDGIDISMYAHPGWTANEMANAYVEHLEDRAVEAAFQKNMDRTFEAAAELDERFAFEETKLPSLDEMMRDAVSRVEAAREEKDDKVINFPRAAGREM